MKIKIFLILALLVIFSGCLSKKKVKIECGCIDNESRDILMTAEVGSGNSNDGADVFNFLNTLEEEREIHGLCYILEGSRHRFIFCTDDRRIEDEIENLYREVRVTREEDR